MAALTAAGRLVGPHATLEPCLHPRSSPSFTYDAVLTIPSPTTPRTPVVALARRVWMPCAFTRRSSRQAASLSSARQADSGLRH